MLSRVLTASGAGRALGTLVCSTVLGLAACAKGDDLGTGPQVPGDPPPNQPFKQAAFILDVNTSTHEIKITPPTEKINLLSTSLLKDLGKHKTMVSTYFWNHYLLEIILSTLAQMSIILLRLVLTMIRTLRII